MGKQTKIYLKLLTLLLIIQIATCECDKMCCEKCQHGEVDNCY